ncbi:MAG: hypothetical protein K5694_00845 [Bacilli bacterium]|nr:hypothetical protein [Bacilli bacterium]
MKKNKGKTKTQDKVSLLKIGEFKEHYPDPKSTMKYGHHLHKRASLPFSNEKRDIRVWLPPTYNQRDKTKRYPVIYMSDGQNLVDKRFTKYGDWHLDRVIHQLMEEGYPPVILVGIPCPKDDDKERSNELNPPYKVRWRFKKFIDKPHGDRFIDYIVKTLKPEIDKTFNTNPDREHTGIGGSSMGGIMAFYAYNAYDSYFGFSLAYSIPTFFYHKWKWKKLIKEWGASPDEKRKMAMFVGGKDFEKSFTKGNIWLYNHMCKIGYKDLIHFDIDTALPHHEDSWSKYALEGLKIWLKDLK